MTPKPALNLTPDPTDPVTVEDLFKLFAQLDADRENPKRGKDIHWHISHTHSEVSEVWDAIRKAEPRVRVVEELADVLNMVIVLSSKLDITPSELLTASKRKFSHIAWVEKERAYA